MPFNIQSSPEFMLLIVILSWALFIVFWEQAKNM